MSLLATRELTRLLAAALPLALAPAAVAQEPGEDGSPPSLAEVLPGGAHLVVRDAPGRERPGRIEGLLLFEVGSVHEPAGRTGLLEVLAAALRRGGSVLYTGSALDAWLARNEASLEITSDPNGLEIAFAVPASHLDGLLDRVGSLLTTPSYPAAEVEAARQLTLERLARERSDVGVRAEVALREVALGSACAWARCADPAEVRSITRGEVLSFHRAHLGPANLWVGLDAGDAADSARARVERMVAALPRAAAPIAPAAPGFVSVKPGPIWIVDLPGTSRVELRAAVPAPGEPQDAAALRLWFDALSRADTGDQALIAARRRVRDLRFEPLFARHGLEPLGWSAAGSAPLGEAREAVAALIDLLSSDLKRPVDEALLTHGREADAESERAPASLRALLLDAAAGISPEARERAGREARALETEAVRQAVRSRLPSRPPVLVVVGPARELVEPLESLAPVLLLTGQADPTGTREGLALRARLLEAVGGEEPWARLGGMSLAGEVTYIGSERPVPVRVWRDLLGRRLRLEHVQGGVRTTVVVTPQTGWSRAIQSVYDLPREQWERTLFRERRQLVRVLHDLASDPRIESRRGRGGRLDLYTRDELLCWIELDSLGRPARLGYEEPRGKQGLYTYEEWIEEQGYLWPTRVRQPLEGTLFRWSRFNAASALDGELFERPAR